MKKYLCIVCVICSTAAFAQTSSKVSISSLEFMAGDWICRNGSSYMQEVWTAPSGNSIMGSFREVENGKVDFYEFLVIEQVHPDSVPVLILRHFNSELIGWEDKQHPYRYPLKSLAANKAVFVRPDGKTTFSYERISPDKMLGLLTQERNGKMVTTEFTFTKNGSSTMQKDLETIRSIVDQTAKAINEGRPEGIMEHYSRNILVSYPGIPDTDYKTFEEGYKQMLSAGIKTQTTPIIEEIIVSGDMATIRMTWQTTITEVATQKTGKRKARDFQVWQRENGEWKFTRGMWYHIKE